MKAETRPDDQIEHLDAMARKMKSALTSILQQNGVNFPSPPPSPSAQQGPVGGTTINDPTFIEQLEALNDLIDQRSKRQREAPAAQDHVGRTIEGGLLKSRSDRIGGGGGRAADDSVPLLTGAAGEEEDMLPSINHHFTSFLHFWHLVGSHPAVWGHLSRTRITTFAVEEGGIIASVDAGDRRDDGWVPGSGRPSIVSVPDESDDAATSRRGREASEDSQAGAILKDFNLFIGIDDRTRGGYVVDMFRRCAPRDRIPDRDRVPNQQDAIVLAAVDTFLTQPDGRQHQSTLFFRHKHFLCKVSHLNIKLSYEDLRAVLYCIKWQTEALQRLDVFKQHFNTLINTAVEEAVKVQQAAFQEGGKSGADPQGGEEPGVPDGGGGSASSSSPESGESAAEDAEGESTLGLGFTTSTLPSGESASAESVHQAGGGSSSSSLAATGRNGTGDTTKNSTSRPAPTPISTVSYVGTSQGAGAQPPPLVAQQRMMAALDRYTSHDVRFYECSLSLLNDCGLEVTYPFVSLHVNRLRGVSEAYDFFDRAFFKTYTVCKTSQEMVLDLYAQYFNPVAVAFEPLFEGIDIFGEKQV